MESDFKKALAFLQVDREGKLKIKKIKLLDRITQFYWIALIGATLLCTYYLFSDLMSSENLIHLILVIILHGVMISELAVSLLYS